MVAGNENVLEKNARERKIWDLQEEYTRKRQKKKRLNQIEYTKI